MTLFDAIFPAVAVRLRHGISDGLTRFAAGETVLVRGLENPAGLPASGCSVEILHLDRRIVGTLRDLRGAEVLAEIPL